MESSIITTLLSLTILDKAFNLTDTEIYNRILNVAKVWLDGGSMFGSEGEKFQRINCATPRRLLKKALEQICNAFLND